MRTNQWIRAGNAVEAVINVIVWKTAVVWVPILLVGIAWLAVASLYGPKDYTGGGCKHVMEEHANAVKQLADARFEGDRRSWANALGKIEREIASPDFQRDCKKVKP